MGGYMLKVNFKKIKDFLESNSLKNTWKKVKNKIYGTSAGIRYLKKNRPSKIRLRIESSTMFKYAPKISIVVPLYNTQKNFLCEMIDSVLNQTYANWELCLSDGSDEQHSYVKDLCLGYAKVTKQIKYLKLQENYGISGNSNKSLELASGQYIALLDHDDVLHPSALFDVVTELNKQKVDFIYTDECSFSQNIKIPTCINFKPDYAPDTLRSCNYICHFSVFSRSLLNKTGGFDSRFDGSQDYDLILRLTENANKVVHIPRVLYYWRAHSNSVASDIAAKPQCVESAKKALNEHIKRLGYYGEVEASEFTTYKIKYMISGNPFVSIIIPSKDNVDCLNKCLKSIYKLSTYKNFEVIVVENNSEDKKTFEYYKEIENIPNLKVVNKYGNFNYALAVKFGIEHAKGDYFLFLDDDTEIISPQWMEEMLMFAQRTDVGAVGAKLYYPNDTIEHAGLVLGINGKVGRLFSGYEKDQSSYFHRLSFAQNLSAVSSSCLMTRREVFEEVGGFNDKISYLNTDVDFCLKVRELGYLVVFTPYAEAYHSKAQTKSQVNSQGDFTFLKQRWAKKLDKDPYYNPNLSLEKTDCSIKI